MLFKRDHVQSVSIRQRTAQRFPGSSVHQANVIDSSFLEPFMPFYSFFCIFKKSCCNQGFQEELITIALTSLVLMRMADQYGKRHLSSNYLNNPRTLDLAFQYMQRQPELRELRYLVLNTDSRSDLPIEYRLSTRIFKENGAENAEPVYFELRK